MQVVVIVLLLFPCIPLVRLWLVQSRSPQVTPLERIALLVATCSQAFMLLGLIWPRLVGAGNTDRRYATILINLLVMLLVAGIVVIRGRSLRWRLAFPCLLLCGSWLFAAAVATAV